MMERLAKHPQVGGYGELLLPLEPGQDGWSDWPKGAADRPWFTTWLEMHGYERSGLRPHRMLHEYLDYIYEPRRDLQAIGFKLMYSQVVLFPEILPYLRRRNVRVLHLLRLNLLDIIISRTAMEQRRYPHARSAAEREDIKVQIDVSRLIPQLKRLRPERWLARSLVRTFGLTAQEFAYEDMLAHDTRLLDALRFVGVDASTTAGLDPVLLKLAPSSHREGIANFDEVESCLRGTPFHRYLRP
jgi:hypothetical protein